MGAAILLLATLAVPAWGTTADGQGIRESVRKHGLIEALYFHEYPPADLSALVTNTDTIARVVVMTAHSSLIGEKIWTDFGAQVLSVSKGDRQLETRTITVRKAGGTVSIEGRRVLGTESGFPPFELADEYVLFLKTTPDGHSVVPFGPQGAFKVEGGKVTQVLDGEWNRERGAVELSQFLEEIATAQKKK
jgi:hypothetical protein